MLTDITLEVPADLDPVEIFKEMFMFAVANDLRPPSYWGEDEEKLVNTSIIVLSSLEVAESCGQKDTFIANMPPDVYAGGMADVAQCVVLMADMISFHAPKYLTFENVNGVYKFTPAVMCIRASCESGDLYNTPGKVPAVYTVDNVTYYIDESGEVQWVL